ncbi:unnamed protein product [Rotaria sp. Silwood1]|nr:unnamed protein product [Rotaria sp. Silwood1]
MQTYDKLGTLYHQLNFYDNALDLFKKLLEISTKFLQREYAKTLNNIGFIFCKQGDLINAALQIQQKVLSSNDISFALKYNNIASVYSIKKYFRQALNYYHKELSKFKFKSLASLLYLIHLRSLCLKDRENNLTNPLCNSSSYEKDVKT